MTQNHDANEKIKASKLFSVDGLTAVVTGGGSGLGAYMARSLALNGAAKVYILGRRLASLEKTASSVPGDVIKVIQADVTSKDSLEAAVAAIKKDGTTALDVLIANSGIMGPTVETNSADGSPLSTEELARNMWAPSVAELTTTYETNLAGVHFTIAAFLPLLAEANRQRKPGEGDGNGETLRPRPQIITTGSIGGFSRRPLSSLSYGPSKAGVIHLTKQLSSVLVPHDIRVNVIAPGLYLSEMTQDIYDKQGKTRGHNDEGTFDRSVVPATRTGDESDMAGVVLWLCSRAGAYVNGQVVVTDGGRLAVMPSSY
ncbi:hypothetical protein DV737_g5179, partial [Chaetothyriales sp. CBS 132003]